MMSSDRFEETKREELKCFVSEKESGEERPQRGSLPQWTSRGWGLGGKGDQVVSGLSGAFREETVSLLGTFVIQIICTL